MKRLAQTTVLESRSTVWGIPSSMFFIFFGIPTIRMYEYLWSQPILLPNATCIPLLSAVSSPATFANPRSPSPLLLLTNPLMLVHPAFRINYPGTVLQIVWILFYLNANVLVILEPIIKMAFLFWHVIVNNSFTYFWIQARNIKIKRLLWTYYDICKCNGTKPLRFNVYNKL